MRLLDSLRGEACPGAVPVGTIDAAGTVDYLSAALGMALAGTQRIQADLPPRTAAAWRAIATRFPGVKGLGAWGDRSHKARKSCHNTGHAIDVMTTKVDEHEAIVAWALANRAKYGITLIISRRRKWSAAGKWKARPYLGTSPHTDHVHLSIDCAG